jgi:hypothetical protein
VLATIPATRVTDTLTRGKRWSLLYFLGILIGFGRHHWIGGLFVYSLIRTNSLRAILERELLPFIASLIIAQVFFKWGSFALELVGFIATWYVLGFVADLLLRSTRK